MILGTGVDIVQVSRFERWKNYSEQQLLRIFSPTELADCRSDQGVYRLEKLATRFAAKEAFFKALSSALVTLGQTQTTFPFIAIAPLVCVHMGMWNTPELQLDWPKFKKKYSIDLPELKTKLSLSHEKTHAVAFVVIWK